MVEAFSVTGSKVGKVRSTAFGGAKPKQPIRNSAGMGGNPSSKAVKKAAPNKKPPKTNIFAAAT